VTEAESQVVLNTLTELNFQEEFKEWQALGTVHASRVIVVSRPKVSFWPDGSTTLGKLDGSLYIPLSQYETYHPSTPWKWERVILLASSMQKIYWNSLQVNYRWKSLSSKSIYE
jgi:hypothetical protein